MHLTYRKTCRICGSKALTKVIDLGEQYLQGSFIRADREMPPLRKMPTELVRCGQAVVQGHTGADQRHLVVRAGPDHFRTANRKGLIRSV